MYEAIFGGIDLALAMYGEYPKKILVNPNTEIGKNIGKKFFGIDVEETIITDDVTLVM